MKWRKTAAFILFCGFLVLAGHDVATKWHTLWTDKPDGIRFVAGQEAAGSPRPAAAPEKMDYMDLLKTGDITH